MPTFELFEKLFSNLDLATIQTYALILASQNIDHYCNFDGAGWNIFVTSQNLDFAREQIEVYLKENPQRPSHLTLHNSKTHKNYSMVWIALVLTAVHLAAGKGAPKEMLIRHFGALAEAILNGELYRCITALTLHSNAAHLAGNLAGFALFGTTLCQTVGTGAGWFLILCGGTCGNLLNALFHQTAHLSIGASTAVFSSLGSLSALSLGRQFEISKFDFKAFLPLGGGLALLALLGASPETDILAHLFGFISGFVFAIPWVLACSKRLPNTYQGILTLFCTLIMLAAWVSGFRNSH